MFKEFKIFINQGNVMDLAVAVLIGGAFGKIITALVDNILLPIVGIVMGGKKVDSLSIIVGEATIKYGLFLQSIFDFLIIAFVIFMIVRQMNKMKKITEISTPSSPTQEELLSEIRDLLKK